MVELGEYFVFNIHLFVWPFFLFGSFSENHGLWGDCLGGKLAWSHTYLVLPSSISPFHRLYRELIPVSLSLTNNNYEYDIVVSLLMNRS